MQRTRLDAMECPMARTLDRVGDWWSLLILRDAFHGLSRFDQFQKSLGVAPNILSRRLKSLVDDGLLQRRRYSQRPPRDDYVLTAAGRDFFPIIAALVAFGSRHFAPEGPAVQLADAATGQILDPVLTDARTGRAIALDRVAMVPGPAAGPEITDRIALIAALKDMKP